LEHVELSHYHNKRSLGRQLARTVSSSLEAGLSGVPVMRKPLIMAAVLASCAAATAAHAVDVGESTTVGGTVFLDVSNISLRQQGANGTYSDINPSGTGFDVKRFYLSVDHKFNDIWSANLTTDAQYVASTNTNIIYCTSVVTTAGVTSCKTATTSVTTSTNNSGGASEVFVKKLYLTGKFSDAFAIHVGSYDMPWIPFVESLYGYRYVEKLAADRLGFGNTTDWGANASGAIANNMLNYSVSVLDGGGYKNPTRTKDVDFEGRLGFKPVDWLTVAIGGYTGHLGQVTTANDSFPTNTATRLDGVVAVNFQGFRLGVEYLDARDYKTVNNLTASAFGTSSIVNSATIAPASDRADGISVFTYYSFLEQWSVFARYDDTKLSKDIAPNLKDKYFNAGVSYKPIKPLDVALVYKNEKVTDGSTAISSADANSSYTIGGVNGTTSGKFSEIGVYLQYKF